jgi:hypothetical protein
MARFTSFCGVVSTLNLDRDPTVVSRALAQQSPCTRTYAPTQNTTSQAFDYVRKIPPELIKNHPMTRKTSSGSEASTASGTPGLRILIEPDTPQTGRWVGTYIGLFFTRWKSPMIGLRQRDICLSFIRERITEMWPNELASQSGVRP